MMKRIATLLLAVTFSFTAFHRKKKAMMKKIVLLKKVAALK